MTVLNWVRLYSVCWQQQLFVAVIDDLPLW